MSALRGMGICPQISRAVYQRPSPLPSSPSSARGTSASRATPRPATPARRAPRRTESGRRTPPAAPRWRRHRPRRRRGGRPPRRRRQSGRRQHPGRGRRLPRHERAVVEPARARAATTAGTAAVPAERCDVARPRPVPAALDDAIDDQAGAEREGRHQEDQRPPRQRAATAAAPPPPARPAPARRSGAAGCGSVAQHLQRRVGRGGKAAGGGVEHQPPRRRDRAPAIPRAQRRPGGPQAAASGGCGWSRANRPAGFAARAGRPAGAARPGPARRSRRWARSPGRAAWRKMALPRRQLRGRDVPADLDHEVVEPVRPPHLLVARRGRAAAPHGCSRHRPARRTSRRRGGCAVAAGRPRAVGRGRPATTPGRTGTGRPGWRRRPRA